MTQVVALTAQVRQEFGTGASRLLRKNGMIPATVYGLGKANLLITLKEREITKYYRKPQYMSQVFELEIQNEKHKVLPKDVQLNLITDVVIHADFTFLEKEMQKIKVPIIFFNSEISIGVKKGGYFNIIKRFLIILCPVENLPRKIEINTSDMPIGRSIKAKELILPEGAKLLCSPETVIASIIGKKGKSDTEEETSLTTTNSIAKPVTKTVAKKPLTKK